jgi:hypothetical protein
VPPGIPARCLIAISHSFSRRLCPVLPEVACSVANAESISAQHAGPASPRRSPGCCAAPRGRCAGGRAPAAGRSSGPRGCDLEDLEDPGQGRRGGRARRPSRGRSARARRGPPSRSSVRMRSFNGYSYVITQAPPCVGGDCVPIEAALPE